MLLFVVETPNLGVSTQQCVYNYIFAIAFNISCWVMM